MVSLLEYFNFAKHHARFLAFGFVVAFASSAGQTYFIGIFGPSIREAFSLSHTQWGTIYMIGTLCSAALLPWSGGLLDRFDLRRYAAAVLSGLIVACLFISATPTAFLLIVAVFLLRQFGQGLTSHTAITSMARYMTSGRGKAIAIASMGYSTGEALLPFLAVLCIAAFGWRTTWQIAAMMVVLLIPVVLWLLRGHDERHRLHLDDLNARIASGADAEASRTRRQMLGELRFYLLLPAVMAPSYISTGLFFHHLTLAEAKQWSGAWVTGNYWVYALCAISASLISGPLIDRFSAASVIRFYLAPMVVGLGLLSVGTSSIWVVPYMALLGFNTGIYFTSSSALWAELYGTRYLGGIKSLVGAMGVFASALGPVTIGGLLDLGYSFEQVCVFFMVFCVVATVLIVIGLRRY